MRLRLPLVVATLLALPPPAARAQICVEARVGQERAYGCVNDQLARLARMAHAPLETNTLDARSAAPAVGVFDRSATAERMGNAFGHSAIAQRPPAQVFATPLLPRRP